MQSRNFRLQRVGDINWLERNYKFQDVSLFLDEIIIVDASRKNRDVEKFTGNVSRLAAKVHIPMAIGGGINKISDVSVLFKNGADKITINTALYKSPDLVKEISKTYGAQSIVAVVDYKVINNVPIVFVNNGESEVEYSFDKYLEHIQMLGIGEIMLNSIDKDGTGFGYDISTAEKYKTICDVPLIISGGAGNEMHLDEGINCVSSVATANLFNFIGSGLPNARKYLLSKGRNLADWSL